MSLCSINTALPDGKYSKKNDLVDYYLKITYNIEYITTYIIINNG